MISAFADWDDVRFLSLARFSSDAALLQWVQDFGWTIPIVGEDDATPVFLAYGAYYDWVFVVGRNGVISARWTYGNTASVIVPGVTEEVDAALAETPVQAATWGRLKRLYGDGR